jgi:hypothetical protein
VTAFPVLRAVECGALDAVDACHVASSPAGEDADPHLRRLSEQATTSQQEILE